MLKYEITPILLDNLKKIAVEIEGLNRQTFSDVVLLEMEAEADVQSAYSSTSIEGNPLPLTDVKKILKNKPNQIRNTEREVLNYNESLLWLKKQLDKKKFDFNIQLVLGIHQRVTSGLLSKTQNGKLRGEPVFVNDPKLRKTIYWPPDHQDVARMMKELIAFVSQNRNKIDPIILAGLFHKQFVIIHPFIDGNGRTVRLVTKSVLVDLGIDTFNLFSFENYYNQNVSTYFQKVGVRGNYYDIHKNLNFTDWLEYFSAGILDELLRVRKLLEKSKQPSTPENEISSEQEKILNFIRKHNFIKDRDYAKLTRRAKATRALDFKKLIRLGLIKKMGQGPATYYKLTP
jgi:Fic family protein